MDIQTILKSAQGGAALQNMAKAFGLPPDVAKRAAGSLAEALSQRVQRNSLSRGGIADVVELLTNPAAARAANGADNLAGPEVAGAGNSVLNVLIGDKHISRGIAARTASEAGISEDIAKKMLPVVASMMIGGLQQKAQPEFNRLMRNVPALAMSRNGSPLPLPGEVPMDSGSSGGGGSWGTGAGSGSSQDQNADTEEAPPVRQAPSRQSRPISGGSPLPIPGDSIPGVGRDQRQDDPPDNPYGNLPDIIRRGGVQVPGGGALENVIRSILGSLFGFQNRGILGSLFQLLLIRFLPRILKGILGRIVPGM